MDGLVEKTAEGLISWAYNPHAPFNSFKESSRNG
jgi:hypothetical protein